MQVQLQPLEGVQEPDSTRPVPPTPGTWARAPGLVGEGVDGQTGLESLGRILKLYQVH